MTLIAMIAIRQIGCDIPARQDDPDRTQTALIGE